MRTLDTKPKTLEMIRDEIFESWDRWTASSSGALESLGEIGVMTEVAFTNAMKSVADTDLSFFVEDIMNIEAGIEDDDSYERCHDFWQGGVICAITDGNLFDISDDKLEEISHFAGDIMLTLWAGRTEGASMIKVIEDSVERLQS